MRFHRRHTAILAVLGLALSACGSGDEAFLEYAKAKKMSEKDTAAFMACAKGFKRNKPVFAEKEGNVVMKSVPNEICACQTPVITAVFEGEDYKGMSTFAEYMAKEVKKVPPRFSKKQLKKGTKSPDAVKRLEASFNNCIGSYKFANKEKSAELFELLPPKEPEAKEGEEKKAS